jgi:amino acid transporter
MLLSEIAVVAAIVLAVVLFIAFMQSTPQFFASRLQSLSGISYTQLLAQAKTSGWQPGWNFNATAMAGLTYVNFCILGNTYAANIAGEIKQIRKSSFYAMFGSILFFIAYYLFISYPQSLIPGNDFWGAVGTLSASGTSPFPVFPFPVQLIVYATSNPLLVHLAWITYLIATFGAGTGLMFAPIRNIFAWSFDRVIPTSFAKVDRRGSPYAATILVGAIVLFLIYLTIFTPIMTYNSYSIGLWFTGWTILGIAAVVFPYVRKDIYQKSPEIVRKSVLGIPLITIMGVLTTIISLWTVYSIVLPGLALSQLQYLIGSIAISAVLSFLIFGIAYFYNKSKGSPVSRQFKEIPPD